MIIKYRGRLFYSVGKAEEEEYSLPQHLIITAEECLNTFGNNLTGIFNIITEDKEELIEFSYNVVVETEDPRNSSLLVHVQLPKKDWSEMDRQGMYNTIWPMLKSLVPTTPKILIIGNSFGDAIRISTEAVVYAGRNIDKAKSYMNTYTSSSYVFNTSIGMSQEVLFSIPYMISIIGASALCQQH